MANVTTPSERIWAELEEHDDGPGLEAYLPEVPRDPMTLAPGTPCGRG